MAGCSNYDHKSREPRTGAMAVVVVEAVQPGPGGRAVAGKTWVGEEGWLCIVEASGGTGAPVGEDWVRTKALGGICGTGGAGLVGGRGLGWRWGWEGEDRLRM